MIIRDKTSIRELFRLGAWGKSYKTSNIEKKGNWGKKDYKEKCENEERQNLRLNTEQN